MPDLRALRFAGDTGAGWPMGGGDGLRALRTSGAAWGVGAKRPDRFSAIPATNDLIGRWRGGAGTPILPFAHAKRGLPPQAAGTSFLVHGALFALLLGHQTIALPPGGGEVAQLGTADIDMAAVVSFTVVADPLLLEPVETPPPVAAVPAEAVPADPVAVEPVAPTLTEAPVETVQEPPPSIETAAVAQAVAADPVRAAPVANMATAAVAEFVPAASVAAAETSSAIVAASVTVEPASAAESATVAAVAATEPPPVPATAVSPPDSAAPVSPPDVTQALPDTDPITAVYAAVRPPARNADSVPEGFRSQPEPPPRREEPVRQAAPVQEQRPPQQGNAPIDATAGQAEAAENGNAPSTGPAEQPAQGADSAAAANYPGLVMQRLSRARRERVSNSGSAVIAFTVADGGGLAALGVAQSSGSAEIDNAGLSLVQRAAPFPAPPAGAQRNFSYRFTAD